MLMFTGQAGFSFSAWFETEKGIALYPRPMNGRGFSAMEFDKAADSG
jgi:hypothetical protein